MKKLKVFVWLCSVIVCKKEKPNIVLVVADDLGYRQRDSQVATSFLFDGDTLSYP